MTIWYRRLAVISERSSELFALELLTTVDISTVERSLKLQLENVGGYFSNSAIRKLPRTFSFKTRH